MSELPDQEEGWPRDFLCHGTVYKDLAEDAEAFEAYKTRVLPSACNELAEKQGAKLAEGQEWQVRWREVTQYEEDLDAAANMPYGYGPTVRAGDWRYRAVGKVVPI